MPRKLHDYRRPLSFELVFNAANTLLSPVVFVPTFLIAYRRLNGSLPGDRRATIEEFKARYPKIWKGLIFVILKTVIGWANRYALNGGWHRDRPVWRNEIAVVTGGASGIGKHVVEMMLRNFPGVRVAVFDLANGPAKHNPSVKYYKVNIADADAVNEAADDIRRVWGHPSIVVNNAGIMRSKDFLSLTPREIQTTLNVNVLGAFIVTQAFLPHMISKNHGHIASTCSAASFVASPGMSDYAASKFALLAFHESLSAELLGRLKAPGVKTTAICPVKVNTLLGSIVNDHGDQLLMPTQEPWMVAEKIIKALDSGLSNGVVTAPTHMYFLLPLTRVLPPFISAAMARLQRLDKFATSDSLSKGTKKGYKILADLEASVERKVHEVTGTVEKKVHDVTGK